MWAMSAGGGRAVPVDVPSHVNCSFVIRRPTENNEGEENDCMESLLLS